MIDLHTHVLPGIDDGPPTLEASLELARAAVRAGTTTMVATPHVDGEWTGNDSRSIAAGVTRLRDELRAAAIDLDVRTGAEIAVTRLAELDGDEITRLSLGGAGWVLAECPLSPSAFGFETILLTVAARGHRILLAHPERSPTLQRDPELLRRLVDAGMATSITAGAVVGRFGSTVRKFALWMLEHDLVHSVASDTHSARRRPPGITDALDDVEGDLPGVVDRIAWMTETVPAAILAGEAIPRPPSPPPRRAHGLAARWRAWRS
jgi:protein-tyrosine phosphatase